MEFVLIERFAKRLAYFILVLAAAVVVYHYLPVALDHWLIWSALVFAWVAIGDTTLQRMRMIAISAVIAAIALLIVGLLSSHVWMADIFLILLTMGCAYGGLKRPEYHLALLFINVIALTASQRVISLDDNLLRSGYMLIAGLLASIPQIIFLYHEKQNSLASVTAAAIIELRHIQTEIFACFLQTDYPERKYYYERRIHVCSERFMKILSRYADSKQPLDTQTETMIEQLLAVYCALQSCGQLRWRINDFTLFSLCRDEIKFLSQAFDKLWSCDANHKSTARATEYVQVLEDNISRLEDLYEHVLKVASREPLVFLLFLAGLRTLNVELRKLYVV